MKYSKYSNGAHFPIPTRSAEKIENDIRLSAFALLLYAFVSNWLRPQRRESGSSHPCLHDAPPLNRIFPRLSQISSPPNIQLLLSGSNHSERASMHQMLRPVRFSVAREWYGSVVKLITSSKPRACPSLLGRPGGFCDI